MSENSSETLKGIDVGLKDALVVIPLLASSLAITWEVGYFSRLGGGSFALFSLTEHIAFAVQVLPLAIAVAMMGALGVSAGNFKITGHALRVLNQRGLRVSLFLLTTIIGFAAGAFVMDRDAPSTAISSLALVPFAYAILVPHQYISRSTNAIGAALCVSIVAYGLGYLQANAAIKSKSGLSRLTVGEKSKEAKSNIEVRLLRTGERGILFFDPQGGKLGFLSWDQVRRLDWSPTTPFQR